MAKANSIMDTCPWPGASVIVDLRNTKEIADVAERIIIMYNVTSYR